MRVFIGLLLGGVLVAGTFSEALAVRIYEKEERTYIPTKHSTTRVGDMARHSVVCYDRSKGTKIDCQVQITLTENGTVVGHEGFGHNGGHPSPWPVGGFLAGDRTGDAIPRHETGKRSISGSTNGDEFQYTYLIPEVSQTVKWIIYAPPPPGYTCSTPSGCAIEQWVDVRVWEIDEWPPLQPATDGTYRLTGTHGNYGIWHPQNHFATSATKESVKKIAKEYYKATGNSLGINDMSLQWGGLFDIEADWKPSHSLHRKGTSIDIDSLGVRSDGVPSHYIEDLEDIAEEHNCWRIDEQPIHLECDG